MRWVREGRETVREEQDGEVLEQIKVKTVVGIEL